MSDVCDCNGKPLKEGDAVILTQDLTPKNGGKTIKRGAVMKKIRMVEDDPTHVQGKIDGTHLFIKTEYLKKKK